MNRGCRQLLLVCVSLLALSGCDPTPNPSPRVVRSMLEERRDDVVIQKWDISCGAAALATLLTYDQGYQVTEREVAAGMLHFTTVNRVRAQLGFSLLDLKRFAESRGFTADGYGNMTLRDLVETGPAIVPVVLRGYNHFVVFRGIQGDRVLLADPAWGNRTMQIPYFMNIWESRVAFAVNRNGGKRVHRLEANATDFWASSATFEAPVRKIVVAKLMDEPPAKTQMMVAETSSPLAQTAAGPGGASANGALPDNDQPAVVVTGRTKTVAGATEARAPRSATGTNIVVAAIASPAESRTLRSVRTLRRTRQRPQRGPSHCNRPCRRHSTGWPLARWRRKLIRSQQIRSSAPCRTITRQQGLLQSTRSVRRTPTKSRPKRVRWLWKGTWKQGSPRCRGVAQNVWRSRLQ